MTEVMGRNIVADVDLKRIKSEVFLSKSNIYFVFQSLGTQRTIMMHFDFDLHEHCFLISRNGTFLVKLIGWGSVKRLKVC